MRDGSRVEANSIKSDRSECRDKAGKAIRETIALYIEQIRSAISPAIHQLCIDTGKHASSLVADAQQHKHIKVRG